MINLEFVMDIEEHIPISIVAHGNDLASLISNAEYAACIPDPKKFYNIDNLGMSSYSHVVDRIGEEFAAIKEMKSEARRER